jgi:hypothetical protein
MKSKKINPTMIHLLSEMQGTFLKKLEVQRNPNVFLGWLSK